MTLNTKSIKKAISELKKYELSLAQKNELFVNKLLDLGITAAQQNVGKMGEHITFTKEVDGTINCVGVMIGKDAQKIISRWYYYEDIVGAEISPILFEEFGTGMYASVLFPVDGVGQGTFPGQTHAFEGIWHWRDEDGKWHSSNGFKPSHPMYEADMAMISQIQAVAKEVFGYGI